MSDLRTRIVAALERADKEPQSFDEGPVGYEYLADAVIRELNLTEDDGVIVGCCHAIDPDDVHMDLMHKHMCRYCGDR
jgi:hypothetical protein